MEELPPRSGPCLSVPPRATARVLERLGQAGLVDRHRAVSQRGGRVLVPLDEEALAGTGGPGELGMWLDGEGAEAFQGVEVVEAELGAHPKLAPRERARWLLELEGEVPHELLGELPSGWQVLGDVALVRLPEALEDHGPAVGRALGTALGVASVLALDGTAGELREPRTRLLWGDAETRTVHREHGLVFHLDPAQVLFSAGNKHERHRLVDQVVPGETVVDLFAGVGYFTLPLARAGARVVACEKNPVSAGFLQENVAANGLTGRVEVRQGDCRQVAPEGTADRVLMGYFPGTWRFLGCALRALKDEGGVMHYHTVAEEPDALDQARDELTRALLELTGRPPQAGSPHHVVSARRVKGVGPGRSHVVLDVEVSR